MTESEVRELLCVVIGVFLLVLMCWFYLDFKRKDAAKQAFLCFRSGCWARLYHCKRISIELRSRLIHPPQRASSIYYGVQEATLGLLRYPNYCVSGYSSMDVKGSVWDGEKLFNKLSVDERRKFDEETLVNVNNVRKKSAASEKSKVLSNECIVVTIIVAASGTHKLPPIQSSAQLKEALQKLASIPSRNIMAAEVLWTPQEENDIVTKQQVLEDYPLINSF